MFAGKHWLLQNQAPGHTAMARRQFHIIPQVKKQQLKHNDFLKLIQPIQHYQHTLDRKVVMDLWKIITF